MRGMVEARVEVKGGGNHDFPRKDLDPTTDGFL